MWYPVQNPLANVYLSAIVAFIPLLWLLVGLGWFKIKAY
jgi:lactate permease